MIYYISHGDSIFPFTADIYAIKSVFIWSFQNGAINLDGTLRLIIRIPLLLFFYISDSSVLTSYFYICIVTVVSFLSFYYFTKVFLNVKDNKIGILTSLFFTFNPIFLGNFSKIGLTLGVAMLPVLLVISKKYFEAKENKYLIAGFVCFNVSLIHPFIFLINSICVFTYSLLRVLTVHRNKLSITRKSNWIVAILLFLCCLYFVLPLLSLQTLEKSSIVNDAEINSQEIEGLLTFANTEGILNSILLIKPVLKDYEFFPLQLPTIYALSVISFYIILVSLYLLGSNRISKTDYNFLIIFLVLTLLLILFSTGNKFGVERILQTLNSLPAGWSFRSPLKWQLFIPFTLFSFLALLYNARYSTRERRLLTSFLLVAFIAMNSYIAFDIYKKLIVPKRITHFSYLNELRVENKRLAFVDSVACLTPHPNYSAELNQIFASKQIQVKTIPSPYVSDLFFNDFDYVLACSDRHNANFSVAHRFSNGFILYENNSNQISVVATDKVYAVSNDLALERDPVFLGKISSRPFFVTNTKGRNIRPITHVETLFDDLSSLILNGSFETGLWQEKVGDCNAYDEFPILAMSLNTIYKTDGNRSLQLEATRHNACTSIKMSVEPRASYLLSFDYQSPNATHGTYYLRFNDVGTTTISENIPVTGKEWEVFSRVLKVPDGATEIEIYVYARATDGSTNIINRYDNFRLIEIPDVSDTYYRVSEPEKELVEPQSVTFDLINPTKKWVRIKGATTPFFLVMGESYHDQWQVQFNNQKIHGFLEGWWPFAKPDKVADEYHYKLNGFLNGWYVDVDEYCGIQKLCVENPDGSYDINLVIEFFPQRWFYLGLLISGATFISVLGYFAYDHIRRRSIRNALPSHE